LSAAYVEVCDLVYIQCMTSLPHDGERVRTARALGAFEVSRRFSEHRLSSARTSSLACPLAPALEMMQEPLRSVELVADRCRGTRLERCSVASLAADRHQGSSFGPGYSAVPTVCRSVRVCSYQEQGIGTRGHGQRLFTTVLDSVRPVRYLVRFRARSGRSWRPATARARCMHR